MKLGDYWAILFGVLLIVAVIAWPFFYFFAPCGALEWLPITKAPTRCVLP